MNLLRIGEIEFPKPSGVIVNMMPIIAGDSKSIPAELHGYLPMLAETGPEKGETVYLTIHESVVLPGQTQRRPGIHTDGTAIQAFGGGAWGGGAWGGRGTDPKPGEPKPKKPAKGIYMASNDGLCRVWNTETMAVDGLGSIKQEFDVEPEILDASVMYWITDRTPHESLPATKKTFRQFFRLVGSEVSVWWAQHSTANPLGVLPNCRIEHGNKFEIERTRSYK